MPLRPYRFADLDWQIAVHVAADQLGIRSDGRRNFLAVLTALRSCTDWATLRARPGLATIGARLAADGTPVSHRTVQRHLHRAESYGLLAVLERGCTLRAWRARARGHNLAREWRLTRRSPHSPVTVTPSRPRPVVSPTPKAGKGNSEPGCARHSPHAPPRQCRGAPPWPLQTKPQRRGEALAAVRAIVAVRPVLGQVRERRLRAMLLPWFAAGWTPAQLLHAIDHQGDGARHQYGQPVRWAAPWLAWRLAHWLGPDRLPGPAPDPAEVSNPPAAVAEPELTAPPAPYRAPTWADVQRYQDAAVSGAALARRLLAETSEGRRARLP